MLETIEKYRDLTETEKQNSIKKYIELSDDEKAFLEINIGGYIYEKIFSVLVVARFFCSSGARRLS